MHAKTREIPWGYIFTGLTLLALSVALVAGITMLGAPGAEASTVSYLKPAVTATRVADFTRYLTTVSSSGMGINPAAVAAPAAGQVGRERIAAATVDHGDTGRADRVTQWSRVVKHCHKIGCTRVPATVRRELGIKRSQPALMHVGNSTFIWVKLAGGRVRTYTS
jgi:hypothetical protein